MDQLYCCGAEPRCAAWGSYQPNRDSDSELAITAIRNCRLAFVDALEYNLKQICRSLIRFTDPRERDNQ